MGDILIRDLIIQEAQKAKIPPELALAIAEQESGPQFNPGALGPEFDFQGQRVRAKGTFQLIPSTAQMLGVNPDDPVQNVQGGIKYIRQLMERHGGNLDAVLAEYGGVKNDQNYVPGVKARLPKFVGLGAAQQAAAAETTVAAGADPTQMAQPAAEDPFVDLKLSQLIRPVRGVQKMGHELAGRISPETQQPLPPPTQAPGSVKEFLMGLAGTSMSGLEELGKGLFGQGAFAEAQRAMTTPPTTRPEGARRITPEELEAYRAKFGNVPIPGITDTDEPMTPQEGAMRGLLAGWTQTAAESSPADIIGLKYGPRTLRGGANYLRSKLGLPPVAPPKPPGPKPGFMSEQSGVIPTQRPVRVKPGEVPPTPKRLTTQEPSPITEAQAEANQIGPGRLVAGKSAGGTFDEFPTDLPKGAKSGRPLEDIMEETIREVGKRRTQAADLQVVREGEALPPDVEPPMPELRSRQMRGRQIGPAIPDPPGMAGFAQESGAAAAQAPARAARAVEHEKAETAKATRAEAREREQATRRSEKDRAEIERAHEEYDAEIEKLTGEKRGGKEEKFTFGDKLLGVAALPLLIPTGDEKTDELKRKIGYGALGLAAAASIFTRSSSVFRLRGRKVAPNQFQSVPGKALAFVGDNVGEVKSIRDKLRSLFPDDPDINNKIEATSVQGGGAALHVDEALGKDPKFIGEYTDLMDMMEARNESRGQRSGLTPLPKMEKQAEAGGTRMGWKRPSEGPPKYQEVPEETPAEILKRQNEALTPEMRARMAIAAEQTGVPPVLDTGIGQKRLDTPAKRETAKEKAPEKQPYLVRQEEAARKVSPAKPVERVAPPEDVQRKAAVESLQTSAAQRAAGDRRMAEGKPPPGISERRRSELEKKMGGTQGKEAGPTPLEHSPYTPRPSEDPLGPKKPLTPLPKMTAPKAEAAAPKAEGQPRVIKLAPLNSVAEVIKSIPKTGDIEFDNAVSNLQAMRAKAGREGLTDTEFNQYGQLAELVRQHPRMPQQLEARWKELGAETEARGPKFQPGQQVQVKQPSQAEGKPRLVKPTDRPGAAKVTEMPLPAPEMEGGLPKLATPMGIAGESIMDFIRRYTKDEQFPLTTAEQVNRLPNDIREGFVALYKESQAKLTAPKASVTRLPPATASGGVPTTTMGAGGALDVARTGLAPEVPKKTIADKVAEALEAKKRAKAEEAPFREYAEEELPEVQRQAEALRRATTEEVPKSVTPETDQVYEDIKARLDAMRQTPEQIQAEILRQASEPRMGHAEAVQAILEKRAAAKETARAESKVSAEDRALLAEGEKAGIGPPPAGTDPVVWAKVNSIANEARYLYMRDGTLDPRLLDVMRRYWGAEETARRLGGVRRVDKGETRWIGVSPDDIRAITSGKRMPLEKILRDMERRFQYLIDAPEGFMRTEAIAAMAGGAAGGLLGATLEGESAVDRGANVLAMMAVMGTLGYVGARGIERYVKGRAPKGKETETWTRFAMRHSEATDTAHLLTGPAVIKAGLGSIGGGAIMIGEKIAMGDMKAARRGLAFMKNEAVPLFIKTLRTHPDKLGQRGIYAKEMGERLGAPASNFISDIALRPFIAMDRVGTELGQRMGYSRKEAARMLVTGDPTTWQGQAMMGLLTDHFITRMLAKFARVRVIGLERAFEFTPGLHLLNTRHTRGVTKGSITFKPPPDVDLLTKRQRNYRAAVGGTLMAAGSAYGYWRDPGLAEQGMVSSIAGPAFVPAAMGMQMGKALKRGELPFMDAFEAIGGQIPGITEASFRRLDERLPFSLDKEGNIQSNIGLPLRRLLGSMGVIEPPRGQQKKESGRVTRPRPAGRDSRTRERTTRSRPER